jgi:hypothetical protein
MNLILPAVRALEIFLYFALAIAEPVPNISLQRRPSALAQLTGLNFDTFSQAKTNPSQRALNYALYNIQLDGRSAQNWQPFLVKGQLMITDGIAATGGRNGPNPVDILVSVGSPAANPQAGSIWYASNRYLYKLRSGTLAQSAIDYAYVAGVPGRLNVTVDRGIASSNTLSHFNARSGILASVYQISAGSFILNVGTSISGSVKLSGMAYLPPEKPEKNRGHNRNALAEVTPYTAVVSGTLAERGSRAI